MQSFRRSVAVVSRFPVMDDAVKEAIAREWRELGIFYDRDDASHEWRFHGSRAGFTTFANALLEYAAEAKNERMSEHVHLGPFMYLKVTTWKEPCVDRGGVRGTL